MFPYYVSIPILSEITRTKPKRLRKMYAPILDKDCVPLTEIPFVQQEAYIKDYLGFTEKRGNSKMRSINSARMA